mmetsp:Transcript_2276/g.5249  ORF Transcript_2276/g.5249 Transcript_2276/m.5249 type:complete len:470 (-) Transcript_2276:482-1891(-)
MILLLLLSSELLLLLLDALLGLHGREEDNLLDGVLVGQEHGETVDTKTPASGGRKANLEGLNEALVDGLGLIVSSCLILHLLLETSTLVNRVVQLSVCVGKLLGSDKELEALSEEFVIAVLLGKRGHDKRVVSEEGGVNALGLKELANESIEHARGSAGRRAVELVLLEKVVHELHGLLSSKIVGESNAKDFLKTRLHGDALEGRAEVDCERLLRTERKVLNDVAAANSLNHAGKELLGHVHEVIVVCVGLVHLTGSELRVVGRVDALVAEVLADLVHAVKTSNDKLLEEEFGSNAHGKLCIERVVVGEEGLGGGTSSLHVEHGCLDFKAATGVEEATHVGNDLGTLVKDLAGGRCKNKIKVTLAVANVLVSEHLLALLLHGKHVQTRGQKLELGREDGQLTLLTLTRGAHGSHNISAAQRVVYGKEGILALRIGLHLRHDLHTVAVGLDRVKYHLGSLSTLADDAACN